MTGPEHYKRAEEILDDAVEAARGATGPVLLSVAVAEAQAHATLALAAATALSTDFGQVPQVVGDEWWDAAAPVPRVIPAAD